MSAPHVFKLQCSHSSFPLTYFSCCHAFFFCKIFFKNSPGWKTSQGRLLVSFTRRYIRFILILSIKGDLTSSRSSAESGPQTLWHRNKKRTAGGKVLEPAAVLKHLWQREQGTVVTKCLNYRKPEHTRFVSASPQHCHRVLKTGKCQVHSVIHPSEWTSLVILVAAHFLPAFNVASIMSSESDN